MCDFFDDRKKLLKEKQKKQEELMGSQKYQQEIKYFDKLIGDFIEVVRVCSLYSTRDFEFSQNSLLFNHSDEFLESAISCAMLVQQGAINPVYRELRYMLEASMKYLVVDQTCVNFNYQDKIKYLDEHIPKSSISFIKNIDIIGLDILNIKEFINSANDVYKKLCQYVHPTKSQIDEIIDRYNRGSYIGFESEKELKRINNLIYKVFEIVIALHITNLGVSSAGDVFIFYLDKEKDWKFHKSKYIKKISEFYDYKYERKNKNNQS